MSKNQISKICFEFCYCLKNSEKLASSLFEQQEIVKQKRIFLQIFTLIEIANFHGKTVFDVAMSKLCVLMSWWPFMASKYLGKISKAKKGHSKVSKGQIKIDHHSLYMILVIFFKIRCFNVLVAF